MPVPHCELARVLGPTAPCFDPAKQKLVNPSRADCIPRVRESCAARASRITSHNLMDGPIGGTDPIVYDGGATPDDEMVHPEEMV